ncbi:transglutaminase domain-containing protein [Bacillus sp. 2205SS5-2]|uniref:transglutaminase domain-containing protein n=1 Tax=Bacillus sp. 2205SS5-2 TaxID=3109031 RepID=UPI0030056C58
MSEYVQKNWQRATFFLMGFILLWEWLRPLEVVTDTGDINYFLFFIFMSLCLAYYQASVWLSLALKTLVVLYSIHALYYSVPLLSFEWVGLLLGDVFAGVGWIFQQEWTQLTNPLRTLLFFILLWLMTYLVNYWLDIKRSMFLFFVVTIIYIAILDTFTVYDAKFSIIRTVILGFILLGLLALEKLSSKENFRNAGRVFQRWVIPLLLMVSLTSLFAYIAPKAQQPKWPDPVPYITSLNPDSGVGPGGVSKIGYGENDSVLGGPFIGDDTLIYQTEVKNGHYWKIETKSVYTGKGWIVENGEDSTSFEQEQSIPYLFHDPTKEEVKENVKAISNFYAHVAYPYGLEKVTFGTREDLQMTYNILTEKIRPTKNDKNVIIKEYSVTYREPAYIIDDMKKMEGAEELKESKLYQLYTQLPPELPERVSLLAEEITSNETNWYDKARAVEGYFRRNGFVYDQEDVLIPGPEDDYVDQFLFDSMRGYCDNYSTSMVVLLRSVGVPARWVKGFTDGEFVKSLENSYKQYDVTNNNAHSWVEVYFPEAGWVPFEPTVGFSNSVNYRQTLDEPTDENPNEEVVAPVEKTETPDQDLMPDELSDGSSPESESTGTKVKNYFINHWFKLLSGTTVLVGLLLFLYIRRAKWLPYVLMIRYGNKKQDKNFMKAYVALLRQLERYGLKKEDDQTLRSYAHYIDSFFGTREMTSLTRVYEKRLYGASKEGDWNELKELWENLIKKTAG